MLTIKAEIKKQEQKLDGTYNVKLRFTLDRKVKRLSTSLFVTNKDLTKDLKIKQASPIRQEVDSLIRSYQEKCAKLQIELNHYTLNEVMDYLEAVLNFSKKFFWLDVSVFVCALGDFLVLFAPVLRQIARYLPHHTIIAR